MTADDRLALARKLMRASLALPRGHEAHAAIDAAVDGLLGRSNVVRLPVSRPSDNPPPTAA